MAVTLEAWTSALQALLPPGRAFTREPNSILAKVLAAISAMYFSAQSKVDALVDQADPRRADELLSDWETMLALPDRCTPAGQNVLDRQRAVYQRLVEQGGQSRAYFIGLAELLGEAGVTITEFRRANCNSNCNSALYTRSDLFTWRVNIPRPALNARWANCQSNCNDALQMYTPSVIECALTERKPAHTHVIFAYAA